MKRYNRIMLGQGGRYAEECLNGQYIGCDFGIDEDLTGKLCDEWNEFKKAYLPVYLKNRPEKSKTAAGLACGALWTICKGLNVGDTVICPNGEGGYIVGNIDGDYYYEQGKNLPHRRPVKWTNAIIRRSDMSQELKNSSGSIGTCCDVSSYAEEIKSLISKSKLFDAPLQSFSIAHKTYLERDLHKLFSNYLSSVGIIAKTIYHEHSHASKDSNQKWVHPDLVGVRFADFKNDATSILQRAIEPKKAAQIFSFEMKRVINDDYSLKQYYFQALSNSSWANYGYLVAFEIDDGLKDEIERLNAAFGIGVILLKAKPEDTKVLFAAREKGLDYATIDKLCNINKEFNEYISAFNKVLMASKDYTEASMASLKSLCDDVFKSDEELVKYCIDKGIPY